MNRVSSALAEATSALTASGTFAIRDLSVLAYANGFTLWHYKGGRARLAEITARNFFGLAADMISTGDMVMISAADGCCIACARVEAGNVEVAALNHSP